MAASSGISLFAKFLLYANSVVMANCVQDRAAIQAVHEGEKCFRGYQEAFFWQINFLSFLFDCKLQKDAYCYVSILVGFCKLNHCWITFRRKLCILG